MWLDGKPVCTLAHTLCICALGTAAQAGGNTHTHMPACPPSTSPVKQNWQFMAQPTWEETHSVTRALVPPSRTTGINTVSTCGGAVQTDGWPIET